MLDNSAKLIHQLVSAAGIREIDKWIAKYPADQKQSAVMTALMVAQEEHGYLTQELMDAVAQYLEMPPIAVYEVATFYNLYTHINKDYAMYNGTDRLFILFCIYARLPKNTGIS